MRCKYYTDNYHPHKNNGLLCRFYPSTNPKRFNILGYKACLSGYKLPGKLDFIVSK